METANKDNSNASLGYMLFMHRGELRTNAKNFHQRLRLTKSKFSITNKLVSLDNSQVQQMNCGEFRSLKREKKFGKYLKTVIELIYEWQKSSLAERGQIMERLRCAKFAMEKVTCNKFGEENEEY